MTPYISNPNDYYYYNSGYYAAQAPSAYGNPYGYPGSHSLQDVSIAQLQPIVSDNPAVPTLTLFKELTGYPNYGNPSGNADILYTGTRGEWTFEVPAFFFIPGLLRAQLNIRAVLDDGDTPVRQYSATISINGRVVHRGQLPLAHGRPFGQQFDNWRILTYDVPDIRRVNRVVITNTSSGRQNDWIGLDWMEMRFQRR